MNITAVTDVSIKTFVEGMSDGLRGVMAKPDGPGPWPGVVVLHEAFGIDDEMRKQVAHVASLGYIALMPDLFTEGGFRRCINATFRSLGSGTGRAYSDIEAARQELLAREDCTGQVGSLGFCMGGGFALMTAPSGFDAASVSYGMLPTDSDVALEGACPIVASYGKKDVTLRGAAPKLEAVLTAKNIDHDVKEYDGAGHIFMNEKMNGPVWIRPIVRVMGFGPRPDAAADAWARIETFFARHL